MGSGKWSRTSVPSMLYKEVLSMVSVYGIAYDLIVQCWSQVRSKWCCERCLFSKVIYRFDKKCQHQIVIVSIPFIYKLCKISRNRIDPLICILSEKLLCLRVKRRLYYGFSRMMVLVRLAIRTQTFSWSRGRALCNGFQRLLTRKFFQCVHKNIYR